MGSRHLVLHSSANNLIACALDLVSCSKASIKWWDELDKYGPEGNKDAKYGEGSELLAFPMARRLSA